MTDEATIDLKQSVISLSQTCDESIRRLITSSRRLKQDQVKNVRLANRTREREKMHSEWIIQIDQFD